VPTDQLKHEIVKTAAIHAVIQKFAARAQINEIHDCHNCCKKSTA